MKKTLALILAAVMLLLSVGCTRKADPTPAPDTDEIGQNETKTDETNEDENKPDEKPMSHEQKQMVAELFASTDEMLTEELVYAKGLFCFDREYRDITYNIAYLQHLYDGEKELIGNERLNDWVNNVFLLQSAEEQNALPTMYQAIHGLGIDKDSLKETNDSRKALGDKMTLSDDYIDALYLEESEMKEKLVNPLALLYNGKVYTWNTIKKLSPAIFDEIDEDVMREYIKEVGEYALSHGQNDDDFGIYVTTDSSAIQSDFYMLIPTINDKVKDDGHNRQIRLYKLDADSACTDAINGIIFESPLEILDKYTDSAPIGFQNLLYDTTFTDDGSVLSVAVLGKLTRTSIVPLFSDFVYWDYKNDVMLSLEEYAERVGISLDNVGAGVDEYLARLGNGSYASRFEYNIEGMFSWKDSGIFVITISPKEEYEQQTSGDFTVFYSAVHDAVFPDDLFREGFDGFDPDRVATYAPD